MIYARNYRSIFPLTPSELRRLANQIEEIPGGCWLWVGSLGAGGYGRVQFRGALWQVHRIIYELFVGPVPEGRILHHRCRHKNCCNPAHLKPIPQSEHITIDATPCVGTHPTVLRTWCRNGHELTDENTRWRTVKGKRWRVCLTCEAATNARKNERRRAKRAARRASSDGSSQSQSGG